MKAIAIRPGMPGSLHLRDVARPSIDDVPGGRGVRVGIIRAGLCGTDADLVSGEYGRAPEGADFLVLGHESLGRVLEVGPGAAGEVEPGQLVVVTIRRPGGSEYDRIGRPDLSTDDTFIETGISRAHGFMTEEVVADAGAPRARPGRRWSRSRSSPSRSRASRNRCARPTRSRPASTSGSRAGRS